MPWLYTSSYPFRQRYFYPVQLRFILQENMKAMEFTIGDIRLAERKKLKKRYGRLDEFNAACY